MALFRCNKCGHIREVGSDYIGKSVKCPKCDQMTRIHDTVTFINALVRKHIDQKREFRRLQQEVAQEDDFSTELIEDNSIEELDIYNTNALTQADQYEPIVEWFTKRKIQIHVNQEAIDTTGFFDEIALALGNNFNVLKLVGDQIKYIQNKDYTNVKVDVSKKKQTK